MNDFDNFIKIVAKGFKKVAQSPKIAQSGHPVGIGSIEIFRSLKIFLFSEHHSFALLKPSYFGWKLGFELGVTFKLTFKLCLRPLSQSDIFALICP